MKKMKKLMALIIACVMIVAMAMPAMASAGDYQIIIDNAVNGETYTAYKIFDETQGSSLSDSYIVVPSSDVALDANKNVIYYIRTGDGTTGSPYVYNKITDRTADLTDKTVVEIVKTPVSYTISTNSLWYNTVSSFANTSGSGMTLTASAGDSTKMVVTVGDTFSAASFAQTLKTFLDGLGDDTTPTKAAMEATAAATETVSGTADGKSITSKTLNVGTQDKETYRGAGYYFVDTSAGALCALNTTIPTVTVKEKNSIPTEDKEVYNTTSSSWGTSDDAQVGDTVYFHITVTDGIGTDTAITVYDNMSDGLTFNDDIAVYKKVTSPDVVEITDYYELTDKAPKMTADTEINAGKTYYTQVATGDNTWSKATSDFGDVKDSSGETFTPDFSVTLAAAYVKALGTAEQVVIYYTGTVNDAAVIAPTANTNETILKYGEQTTVKKEVKVYTYEFDLVKDNSSNEMLADAEFNLYRADQIGEDGKLKSDATPISFYKKTGATEYKVKQAATAPTGYDTTETTTLTSSSTTAVNIEGLDVGDYYLVETKAPAGYNALTTPIKVTVSQAITTSGETTTVTGTNVLPVTGTASGDTITYTPASGAKAGTGVATITTGSYTSGGVAVLNQAGSTLPSTGGMGTRLIYIIGAILVVGAGVILVSRRKIRAQQ